MTELSEFKSLHEMGVEILKLFKQVKGIDFTIDSTLPHPAVAAEADRFELWSINLGLFVPGHGSLDYRLRQAEGLKDTIRTFLTCLHAALEEALAYWASEDNASAQESSADAAKSTREVGVFEDEDDLQELGSDMDFLLDSFKDPIDRLYKVSTWIRSPSSRFTSSKALCHKEIDIESNVDLLQVVANFDYDYVSSIFLQYKKTRALKEGLEPRPSTQAVQGKDADKVWEPIQSVLLQHWLEISRQTESFLVGRIARPNVRRRQQFAYWKKHRDKLRQHSMTVTQVAELSADPKSNEISLETAPRKPLQTTVVPTAPSITTATNLQISQMRIRDDESQTYVSEYAPSMSNQGEEVVEFPPPPTHPSDQKFFECPYCFTLCPKATSGQKAWKAHLVHDLRPYICTYEKCKNPDQLFDTRQDWIRHEAHRKVFLCPEHQHQTFNTRSDLEIHLESEHRNDGRKTSEILIEHASDSVSTQSDRDCPICSSSLSNLRVLQNHIALHMERFALFALPRNVNENQDELEEASSHKANIAADDSRTEDFDTKMDFAQNLESENSDSESSASDTPSDVQSARDVSTSTYVEQERWGKAQELVGTGKRVLGEGHPDTLISMANLASIYRKRGQWKEAEELELHLVQTRKRVLGEEHPDTLISMANLASTYQKRGQWKEAKELQMQVMETRMRVIGEEHPETLTITNDLAWTYCNESRWKESEEMYRRALEGREKVLGVEHPSTLSTFSDLAMVLYAQEKYEAAEQMYRRALKSREKVLGVEHPDTLASISDVAIVLHAQGKYAAAEQMYHRELEGKEKILGVEHPNTLTQRQEFSNDGFGSRGSTRQQSNCIDGC